MKSKNGDVIQWAAPLRGLSDIKWWKPILEHWGTISVQEGETTPLYQRVNKKWEVNPTNATSGTVQATLTRIEKEFGMENHLKIHSPRTWYATLARQLAYPREDREKLGHWAPGSLMPDRYDRALCSTELRLRNEILTKIREQNWEPVDSYEVSKKKKIAPESEDETSSVASTSVTSTASWQNQNLKFQIWTIHLTSAVRKATFNRG